MKVLVIGGVAAGTKAAAKLKREDGSAQVKILTKGQDISYAGCGLPYYVGGLIGTREELIVNSPEKYAGLTGRGGDGLRGDGGERRRPHGNGPKGRAGV